MPQKIKIPIKCDYCDSLKVKKKKKSYFCKECKREFCIEIKTNQIPLSPAISSTYITQFASNPKPNTSSLSPNQIQSFREKVLRLRKRYSNDDLIPRKKLIPHCLLTLLLSIGLSVLIYLIFIRYNL